MKLKQVAGLLLSGIGIWAWMRQRKRANPISLKDKVVIITGASSGIGYETAKQFAQSGAKVVLVARRENLLLQNQTEIDPTGENSLVVTADVSQNDDLENIVTQTMARFGRIDILINNAGIAMGDRLENHDPDYFKLMLDVNNYGAMRLTQLVVPIMKTQNSGHICHIASVAGLMNSPGQSIYGASKAALISFAKSTRRELQPHGISVTAVLPGWTATPMIETVDIEAFPGTREGFIVLQEPSFVAQKIREAVQSDIPLTILGGIGFKALHLAERIDPGLSHFMLRSYGIDDMVELMSKFS